MKEIINIALLIFFGVLYLTSFTKVQSLYFNNIWKVRSNAISALYLGSILSAGIVLIDISKSMTDAFSYFYDQSQLVNAFLYLMLYFISAWAFSLGLFHVSFLLVSMITKENEKIELANNNLELALVHSAILILLALVVAPALSQLASSFIPYPELPF
jgi:hypothetical protein